MAKPVFVIRLKSSWLVSIAVTTGILVCWSAAAFTQPRRHIKVVLETKQTGTSNRETVHGSGSVVIRRDTVQPSGRITANESQTTTQRSSGIFTLVLDGNESVVSVTTRVPHTQIAYYQNYAARVGYVDRSIIFNEVGTSMRVGAAILPEGQIHLRLTPRIAYFSAGRSGAIDVTEAASDLIVGNGQPVNFGGSIKNLHEITRLVLGYDRQTGTSESHWVVTATIQN
jgi:hypothetical protein